MTAAEILAAEIDDRPQQLVDYADENEIGEVYSALYAVIRNPVDSDQYQNAMEFLEGHVCRAIQLHAVKNGDEAAERAREYHNELMREAA